MGDIVVFLPKGINSAVKKKGLALCISIVKSRISKTMWFKMSAQHKAALHFFQS